ncbi:MAG: regulatory protein GemA [Zoogloeaceae bacterium]|jgi:hypothetical protein|nr:regulatory protein GemA [Zoogloeaceae bacterium]
MSDLQKHTRQLLGIAKGWAMKNLPGWSEDCHRDLLARHGGTRRGDHVSALTMTMPQLSAALADYERRGWPRTRQFRAGASAKKVPPRIGHIVRLWGRLGQAGKVKSASRPALLAFCARQTSREVADLDSLTTAECQGITEALKSWLAR